ncbi:MAG: glycosyltransferase family 2 protein [Thermoanaerobaculia bacterium]
MIGPSAAALSATFAGALAAVWAVLAIQLFRRRRQAPRLPPPLGRLPGTTILLPVRNEEENLAACGITLLAQQGAPRLRIIDDGSTDGTGAILKALAAREPRVHALLARPLADGWGGKVNALATGFEGVETEWILLTDADTRHREDLLARAHAAVAEHRLDALSLAGRQVADGLGEALLTPVVYGLLDLMLGDWRLYARGEGDPPIANGQYFLLRSEALRAIGGFAAIAADPLDDVALASAFARHGFRVGFRRAPEELSVRMYRGLAATLHGWRRNLALFVAARPATAAVSIALPLATALALGALWRAHSTTLLLACWLTGIAASAIARKSSVNSPLPAAFFPLDVLLLAATLAFAIQDRARGRAASWRGRDVTIPR